MKDEGFCGACCYFLNEDTEGFGLCPHVDIAECMRHCSDECICDSFASEEFKRHQMAVLRKCQRCLKGNVGTKQDLAVEDICFAIDFLIAYTKLF